jgi:prephenate dehydrogenase
MLARSRVGIVGLGLMGGSLALALRGRCALLAGCDRDGRTLDEALRRGVIDCGVTEMRAMRDAAGSLDLLILATPIGAMLDLIPQLPALFDTPLHLLDLGSTKTSIVQAMAQLPAHIHAIGGHPLCGKEIAGLDGAEAGLFRDRAFTLTPLAGTPAATLALAHEVIAAIGARAHIVDAERHDRLTAAISHVPYLTSIALVEAAGCTEDDLVWRLAASGFCDSTRLAVSDLTMMLGILATNRAAVLEQLSRVRNVLDQLAMLIESEDDALLRARLEASRKRRMESFQ